MGWNDCNLFCDHSFFRYFWCKILIQAIIAISVHERSSLQSFHYILQVYPIMGPLSVCEGRSRSDLCLQTDADLPQTYAVLVQCSFGSGFPCGLLPRWLPRSQCPISQPARKNVEIGWIHDNHDTSAFENDRAGLYCSVGDWNHDTDQ